MGKALVCPPRPKTSIIPQTHSNFGNNFFPHSSISRPCTHPFPNGPKNSSLRPYSSEGDLKSIESFSLSKQNTMREKEQLEEYWEES